MKHLDFCIWSHIDLGQRAHWKSVCICISFSFLLLLKSCHCLFPPFTLRLDPSPILLPPHSHFHYLSHSQPPTFQNARNRDKHRRRRIGCRFHRFPPPTFRSSCRFDASHARNESWVSVPISQRQMQLSKRIACPGMVVKLGGVDSKRLRLLLACIINQLNWIDNNIYRKEELIGDLDCWIGDDIIEGRATMTGVSLGVRTGSYGTLLQQQNGTVSPKPLLVRRPSKTLLYNPREKERGFFFVCRLLGRGKVAMLLMLALGLCVFVFGCFTVYRG